MIDVDRQFLNQDPFDQNVRPASKDPASALGILNLRPKN